MRVYIKTKRKVRRGAVYNALNREGVYVDIIVYDKDDPSIKVLIQMSRQLKKQMIERTENTEFNKMVVVN